MVAVVSVTTTDVKVTLPPPPTTLDGVTRTLDECVTTIVELTSVMPVDTIVIVDVGVVVAIGVLVVMMMTPVPFSAVVFGFVVVGLLVADVVDAVDVVSPLRGPRSMVAVAALLTVVGEAVGEFVVEVIRVVEIVLVLLVLVVLVVELVVLVLVVDVLVLMLVLEVVVPVVLVVLEMLVVLTMIVLEVPVVLVVDADVGVVEAGVEAGVEVGVDVVPCGVVVKPESSTGRLSSDVVGVVWGVVVGVVDGIKDVNETTGVRTDDPTRLSFGARARPRTRPFSPNTAGRSSSSTRPTDRRPGRTVAELCELGMATFAYTIRAMAATIKATSVARNGHRSGVGL
jgi:hypothetical protein